MPRRLARTIEEARDLSIWHQTRQLTQERYRILRRRPMVPADSIQSQLDVQCSVVSAPPVQNHADDCAFLAHHDLVERCAQDPLARSGCGCWMRPGQLEIGASSCLCAADVSLVRVSIALTAASTPSGFRIRSTSAPTAASMLKPLIEMQRAVPWFAIRSKLSTSYRGRAFAPRSKRWAHAGRAQEEHGCGRAPRSACRTWPTTFAAGDAGTA